MKAKTYPALGLADARRASAQFGQTPRTTGVPLLPPDVDETTWLAARRRDGENGTWRIGASELAAVLGISPPYSSPFALWWQKTEGWDIEANDVMKIGQRLEPVIGELFSVERPDLLVCRAGARLWRHPEHEWLVASPDFLAIAADDHGVHVELVEAKSDEGGGGWGKPGTGEVPAHHEVQLLVQCAIFGAPRGHLVRLAGKRFSRYTIEVDDVARAKVAEWVKAGAAFVSDLDLGVPPDIDDTAATEDTLKRLHPAIDEDAEEVLPVDLAAAYLRRHAELDAAKAAYQRVCNRVRDRMGRAQYAVDPDGRRIAQRLIYKRRAYEVPAGMVDQLRRKAK